MIPITLTDIANQALAFIGEKMITNIEEDREVARVVNALISQTIAEVQNLISWPELQLHIIPSLKEEDAETGLRTYNLPSNFMQVLSVNGDENSMSRHWCIEGDKLKTHLEIRDLFYKRYTEEVSEWGEDMRELVYLALAAKIVGPLLQNQQLTSHFMEIYDRKKNPAICRAKNRGRKREKNNRFYGNNRSRLAYGGSFQGSRNLLP